MWSCDCEQEKYGQHMATIEWRFLDTNQVLAASLECSGKPLLQSGKLGWYHVSDHIPWRLNWSFQVRCSVTEPKKGYKLPMPASGLTEISFDTQDCGALGALNIDAERLALTFRIPDCLDPPKKSFIWQGAILLGKQPFHCQAKLVIINPNDGSFLRRAAATSTHTGGIEFVSSSGGVFTTVRDSEVRGRGERILAKARERRSEYLVGIPNEKGRTRIDSRAYLRILGEAQAFVDSHPSVPD